MQRDDFASAWWQKLIETLGRRRRSPARDASRRPCVCASGPSLIAEVPSHCRARQHRAIIATDFATQLSGDWVAKRVIATFIVAIKKEPQAEYALGVLVD
jgi:hypothetical protein